MLSATPARAKFKEHLGQANHFLVTALVALHELQQAKTATAPPELRTSWNPKDKSRSIARTRIFVTQSFLGWAVDSVDLYISLLNRRPKIVQDAQLISDLDGAGRSVLRKVRAISRAYAVHPSVAALIDVLITWRNNVFHELSDNRLSAESREALVQHSSDIQAGYRGLVVSGLTTKAERGDDLTFKEAASLINAAHKFVQDVDAEVLRRFDQRAFCLEAVEYALNDRTAPGFAAKFLKLSGIQRCRFVRNWLSNTLGFCSVAPETLEACATLRRRGKAG
ncbi:MAG: hypothetical protein QOK37_4625 [Thermoanaerobaculia bacterium]|jgi:hypothetical protein|nr:hypothetical protein [Thermoanaerobaculia bacterium]